MLNDDDWLQRLTTDAILARSVAGQRALTVQDYTSVNVKTGYQRIISKLFAGVAVGATVNIGFRTGANKIIIKSRLIQLSGGDQIDYRATTGATWTGGTNDVPVVNPNLVDPVASLCTVRSNVTVTVPGTLYLQPYYIFGGGANTGNSSSVGGDVAGLEYVLPANTDFIWTITNSGTSVAKVFWWLTFFEGEPDL